MKNQRKIYHLRGIDAKIDAILQDISYFRNNRVFGRKTKFTFISAHTKPQLHRFSLGRFAARIREISLRETYRPLRPSHPRHPILDLQHVTHDYTARCIGGMHRARSTPVILSRLLAFCRRIRDCTHTHKHTSESVLYSARARISARGKRATKRKRVAAMPANSVPRTSFA